MNLKNYEKVRQLSNKELEDVVGGEWKWSNLEKQQKVTYGICGGAAIFAGLAFLVSTGSLAFELIRNKIKSSK